MIREIRPEDMKPILDLLDQLRRRTPYAHIKPDFPEAVRVITLAAAKRDGFVMVADHGGEITGVMLAIVVPLWWQSEKTGARIASDLAFYSKRIGDGAKLLAAMIEWAFSVPRVVRIECGVSSGENIEQVERLYRMAGFQLEGTRFVLDHPKYHAVRTGNVA